MRCAGVVSGLVLALVGGAAAASAPLPSEGIAVDRGHGVELRALDGQLLQRLRRFRLDDAVVAVPGVVRMRDAHGRAWIVGGGLGLRRAGPATPLAAGATLLVERGRWSVRRLRGERLFFAPLRGGVPVVLPGRDAVSARGFALDLHTGRRLVLPRDCAAADRRGARWLLLCGGRAYAPQRLEEWRGSGRRVLASNPFGRGVGHWVSAALSPDGTRVLAQWSAECEVPVAFLGPTARGRLRAVGAHDRDAPTSLALGWTHDARAVVALPEGACGGAAARPGVYVVGRGAKIARVAVLRGLRTRAAFWRP